MKNAALLILLGVVLSNSALAMNFVSFDRFPYGAGLFLALTDDGGVWVSRTPGVACEEFIYCGRPGTQDQAVSAVFVSSTGGDALYVLTASGELWRMPVDAGNPQPASWTLACSFSASSSFIALIPPRDGQGTNMYALTQSGEVWAPRTAYWNCESWFPCFTIVGPVPAQPATWGEIKAQGAR